MPPGLDVEHGVVVEAPAAEHIGVQQTGAAAAVVAGVAGEFVVVAALVYRGRRIVVVALVVDIVVEGAGTHHGAVVVFAQDHLAQRADAVGGEAAAVEVAVGVVGIDPHQPVALLAQAYADAIAGGHRPVDGSAVVELDGFAGQRRGRGQGHGRRQSGQPQPVRAKAMRFLVVVIDHTDSPVGQPWGCRD